MKEIVLYLAVLLPTLFFVYWCVRTVDPKHPERLRKFRKKLGVNVADDE